MSGPTAGRLIVAEIQHRFASFKMPILHRRISASGLHDDFRPGVELGEKSKQGHIDLSDEFERQFFGDLMLFTTEALVIKENVNKPFPMDLVVSIIDQKESELLQHDVIIEKSRALERLVFSSNHWWLHSITLANTLPQVKIFIDNINHNFGEQSLAWQQILSKAHRAGRKQQIAEALESYRTEREAWDRLFA